MTNVSDEYNEKTSWHESLIPGRARQAKPTGASDAI